jgi:hypothetical protein
MCGFFCLAATEMQKRKSPYRREKNQNVVSPILVSREAGQEDGLVEYNLG